MNASTNWKDTLQKSATLFDRSAKGRRQASSLLWDGSQEAIEEWLSKSDEDVQAENLSAELLDVLGAPRKGDVSKIKTVALAVKNNGLVLSVYPNLSKAYAEATRLTKTVKVHAAEDESADKKAQEIAAEAPKSSSKPEGAVLIVLAQGVDEAARLIVDALAGEGPQKDVSAARAMLRALAQEISGRTPAPAPKPAKKAAAPKKGTAAKKAAAAPKSGATKPKPVKKAAAPAPVVPDEDPTAADLDDLFDEIEGADSDTEEAVVEAAPVVAQSAKPKPKPVRRGPVKRAS